MTMYFEQKKSWLHRVLNNNFVVVRIYVCVRSFSQWTCEKYFMWTSP